MLGITETEKKNILFVHIDIDMSGAGAVTIVGVRPGSKTHIPYTGYPIRNMKYAPRTFDQKYETIDRSPIFGKKKHKSIGEPLTYLFFFLFEGVGAVCR